MDVQLIMQHMLEPPPRPSTRSLGVPPDVDDLILRCLAKNPADRFESGAELAMAIDALLGRPLEARAASRTSSELSPSHGVTTLESSAAAVATAPTASQHGHGKLYAGIAALLAACGVTIAILASQGPSEPSGTAPEPAARALTPEVANQSSLPSPPPTPTDARPAQVKADVRALLAAFSTWAAAHTGAPCPTSAELGGRNDPWGHPYQLTCTDQPADQTVGVMSMGPDGTAGTDDDVTSWTLGRDVIEIARGKRWTAASMAAKPTPSAPPQPIATAKKPTPDTPAPEKPLPAKPSPTTTPKPPKRTGIVDLDGDGIPDTR